MLVKILLRQIDIGSEKRFWLKVNRRFIIVYNTLYNCNFTKKREQSRKRTYNETLRNPYIEKSMGDSETKKQEDSIRGSKAESASRMNLSKVLRTHENRLRWTLDVLPSFSEVEVTGQLTRNHFGGIMEMEAKLLPVRLEGLNWKWESCHPGLRHTFKGFDHGDNKNFE